VREAVRQKAAHFGGDLKKWTSKDRNEDWPPLKTKTGKVVPIKRVRIKKALGVETIAKGERTRHVALSSNHHVAVFALLDERGREKRWEPEIVSLLAAMERKRQQRPVIRTQLAVCQAPLSSFRSCGEIRCCCIKNATTQKHMQAIILESEKHLGVWAANSSTDRRRAPSE